jgi:predicted ATP-grasp superfamily ATP-dependent carboligase
MISTPKIALFIGLGDWDVPQLEIAKRHGLVTIATNQDSESSGLSACDVPLIVDGEDWEGILREVNRRGLARDIAFVYTGTELFRSAASLAQALGVSWHSVSSVLACQDKSLFASTVASSPAIRIPSTTEARTFQEVLEVSRKFRGKKWVIKPVDCHSSRGVSVALESEAELHFAYLAALAASGSQMVVVQEHVDGTHHDVNAYIDENGEIFRLGINDKRMSEPPDAVVVEVSAPTSLSSEEQETLYQEFGLICKALGLGPGPVKGDFIYSQGQQYCLEVAPRLHGPLGSLYAIPLAYGSNTFEKLLQLSLRGIDSWENVTPCPSEGIQNVHICAESEVKGRAGHVTELVRGGTLAKSLRKSNDDIAVYRVFLDSRFGH